MEPSLPSLSSFHILVTTVVVLVVVKLITLGHFQLTFWKKKGVPYKKDLPILGSTWKMLLQKFNFQEFAALLYEMIPGAKYLGTMDFSTPMLVIRDPEILKDITVKQFDHFPNHIAFIDERTDPIFGKNIFSLRDERWREMRNTLSPSFTASKMRYMFELVSECSRTFVDYFVKNPEAAKEIELKDAFTRYTNDVIASVAFGITVNSVKDRDNIFFRKGAEATNFAGTLNMIKFTLLRACPTLMRILGIGFLKPSTARFFNDTVKDNVKMRDEQGLVRPDMIHLLMQARDKETSKLDIQDIIAQAFIFFLAGFDTSSTLMCFMAYELALNPDVQERLKKEVDEAFALGNGEITYQDLAKMDYMDMVINETLRKYPPAVFIDRVCTKNLTVPPALPGGKELTIEAGMAIWIPVYGFHHDPKYYPNPEKFDPERFNAENKETIDPYTFFPFGLGPRKCIGERFALMETKILIAQILRKFVIKRTKKTLDPVEFDTGSFNLKVKGGFWICFDRRKD